MRMQRVWSWCIRATTALGLIALAAGDVLAQGPANVLVVANAANADSVKIAEAYAKARDIPPEQILKLENMPANAPEQIPAPGLPARHSGADCAMAGEECRLRSHPLHRPDQGHSACA